MDALHPRLLVNDFPATFGFYDAVLPAVCGARCVQGSPDAHYAHWDVDDQGILTIGDHGVFASALGLDRTPAQNQVMLVSRVDDVQEAFDLCLKHGGTEVAGPTARPEWGPTLTTAHVRDPEGNILELQSY